MGEPMPAWAPINEAIAHALVPMRRNRRELVDALAWALEKSCMQFPLIESGEDLDDICPFTFFASFSRPMPDERRARLMSCICEALGVEGDVPDAFPAYPTVEDRDARFFGRGDAQMRHIEALWELFEAAACAPRQTEAAGGSDDLRFAAALDRVKVLRVPGAAHLETALAWVAPHRFSPVRMPAREAAGDEPGDPDPAKVGMLLDGYTRNAADFRSDGHGPWRMVQCFQSRWDPSASDFAAMLEGALAEESGLLFSNYFYNPRKEVLTFARRDPDRVQAAFGLLFDEGVPLVERIVRFEATMAQLFEQYRGLIASAMPRRSSHGNYRAVSAYLFLRFPDRCYPFSPPLFTALAEAAGAGGVPRLSQPESVGLYFALCDAVCEAVAADKELLALDARLRNPKADYPDPAHHLLVDDIARYARSTRGIA